MKKAPTPWRDAWKTKLIPRESLSLKMKDLREAKKKIVSLNGSFDLLHAGHLHLIYEASQLGDCLIVALNTDQSIKSYKNASRPLIPLEQRLQMIAALSFVDFVISFDELDPRVILDEIRPDIHVNGSEYGENCIEAETVKKHGGKIHIVNLLPNLSTSSLIKKIQSENL